MSQKNYKDFDAVKVFDTTGLGGQSGPSPIQCKSYRELDQADFPLQDQGIDVTAGKLPPGEYQFKKTQRFNQDAQLNTTQTYANRDEFDETRAYPDLS